MQVLEQITLSEKHLFAKHCVNQCPVLPTSHLFSNQEIIKQNGKCKIIKQNQQ